MFMVNHLNGFNAGGGAPSFTFVASSGTTTSGATALTLPGTPTAGDLCIIWIYLRNNLSSGSAPSGFTELRAQNVAGAGAGYIYGKKLVGGETTVEVYAGTTIQRAIAATFHPSVPFNTFSMNPSGAAPAGSSECTDGNPASQTIGSSAGVTPVIALGQMGGNGAVSPRSTSPAMSELNDHAQTNHYAHYTIYNPGSTPSDHTYDMDDETAENVLQSGYLTFTY